MTATHRQHVTAEGLGLKLDYMHLTLDTDSGIARLVLDRPGKMNAVTLGMRDQIADVFRVLERDGRARVVIVRGAGEEAFTAGGEIALFCDFRIATSRAVFGLPEVRLGMLPGSGGSQRVARLVGLGRAKDMILRSRRIPAPEAHAWGLITDVVEPDQLESAADALARELLAQPRLAVETAKRVLNLSQDTPLSAGLQVEGYAYGMLRGTPDFAEGVQAFVEKRK